MGVVATSTLHLFSSNAKDNCWGLHNRVLLDISPKTNLYGLYVYFKGPIVTLERPCPNLVATDSAIARIRGCAL